MDSKADRRRIKSLDQFRGYTVAGMFVVNFLGGMAAIPAVLAHHNTYFSYADSIMPGFLFAVGFSFRLTIHQRLAKAGATPTYLGYVRRALALVLVSLVIYGVGKGFSDWSEVSRSGGWEFFARLLKADLWEVLAIIGVTQILVMPVIAASGRVRLSAIVGCLLIHTLLSHSFNFDFVYGRDNWLDAYWGAAGKRAWDGGFFGPISWSVAMLAGSIAYDLASSHPPAQATRRLLQWGAVMMLIGYGLSCLTRLYDVPPDVSVEDSVAASPVWPPAARLEGRSLASLLAEPPFVAPPPPSQRQENYWMMGKRVVTTSFIVFASGFSFAVYAGFVFVCDIQGWTAGLFRTFGQNPLAAYLIHHVVLVSVRALVPGNSPLWYCLLGFAVFFGVTYLFVRQLEKQGMYLRL